MNDIITIFFFGFGLIIGSFLNVVILRYNTEKSLGGRSACMVCRNKLSWYELLPLVSFIILRGRCRSCRTKISWQYPLVEFVTGLIFAGLFLKFQNLFWLSFTSFIVGYAYYATLFTLLIVIGAYDVKHKIIPDMLVLFFGVLSFVGMFMFDKFGSLALYCHVPTVTEMLAGVIVAAPFAFLFFVSRGKWMGLGDAKLMLGMGWLLGLSYAFSAIVMSFWMGAIVGILLIVTSKKYKFQTEIPFAPYLILATMMVFFFEINLLYLNF